MIVSGNNRFGSDNRIGQRGLLLSTVGLPRETVGPNPEKSISIMARIARSGR